MENIKIGIVGMGSQGSLYAEFILQGEVNNVELAAMSSRSIATKQKINRKYPQIPFFRDYNEMFASGLVNAVIICTPHYDHPRIAMEALRDNLHVLLEKPAGVKAKEVRELNEVALSKPSLTFSIFFNQRMNPLYQQVKKWIDRGTIGGIRRTNWLNTNNWRPEAYYRQSDWRARWTSEGGGVLINQAVHQLDLLLWICGMPKRVFSNLKYGYQRDITVEDEATVLIDYGNGATGVFITCTHDLLGTDRFEIVGDKGKIIINNAKSVTIKKLSKSEKEFSLETSIDEVESIVQGNITSGVAEEETHEFTSIWGEQHKGILNNFSANIQGKESLIAPGTEGINSVELLNAIYLSSWLGKEVTLPVDENEFIKQLELKKRQESLSGDSLR